MENTGARTAWALPRGKERWNRFAASVEALQQSLGELNDLATARSFGQEIVEDGWLVGSYKERRNLKAAEDAYRELLRAPSGGLWFDASLRADQRYSENSASSLR
jgi:hypothetical protein